jgi:hypothetical protein
MFPLTKNVVEASTTLPHGIAAAVWIVVCWAALTVAVGGWW